MESHPRNSVLDSRPGLPFSSLMERRGFTFGPHDYIRLPLWDWILWKGNASDTECDVRTPSSHDLGCIRHDPTQSLHFSSFGYLPKPRYGCVLVCRSTLDSDTSRLLQYSSGLNFWCRGQDSNLRSTTHWDLIPAPLTARVPLLVSRWAYACIFQRYPSFHIDK